LIERKQIVLDDGKKSCRFAASGQARLGNRKLVTRLTAFKAQIRYQELSWIQQALWQWSFDAPSSALHNLDTETNT